MPHGLLARQRGAPSIAPRELLLLEASRTPRPCGALTLTYRSGGVALREGPKTESEKDMKKDRQKPPEGHPRAYLIKIHKSLYKP